MTHHQLSFWKLSSTIHGDKFSSAPPPDLAPLKPTEVYDTYWYFAAERQRIFFNKIDHMVPPYTDDPILREHKFTNAYRASDRVSQYLIKNVIYEGVQDPREVFFRIILFKIFNRIDTWEMLVERFEQPTYASYCFLSYSSVLDGAMQRGRAIYSPAYIMASAKHAFGHARKHQNHLKLIELMMEEDVPCRLMEASSMQRAFDILKSYPAIGDFLAYQYVIDVNYSELTNFNEMEFVVPGPGARDGISKCFEELGGLTEPEVIKLMAKRQHEEFGRLGLDFKSLWGRDLQLIDCQNLFCEVDKYARLAHPQVKGRSDRSRIKQKYHPNTEPIQYWYPPKWGLNEEIRSYMGHRSNSDHD